ncbi:N-acetylglutamate synthase, CG3035 family [Corynebacterium bovis]|uniref:GNAT superfamily N-acetyltransferase n=1 Tax=Corynebacterium bovis DSM 20582 = CIP 54.80 TaxID=927655 RepID=A0A8H9Y5R3_9CORY|nr:GNAT family N-acetyltransferase [Corynebacterium bovis]MBB3115487.1 GNAT superfamily N-acetyltransferase [Corynebacterium bovis DSM 20582 = CIP 54.80]QQC46650.1 GNAT family N-acetyltransferase [Corynebacterium bovis]WJY78292.1 Mycothiol acetyltransferase [Corynebacterium bovis DSM 20582 = CIP 54.80]
MTPRDTSWSAAHAGARDAGLPFPVSRWTDPVSVRPGVRVTVRRATGRRAASGRPGVTDVIGTLVSVDPLRVRTGTGPDGADTVELIPAADVVVLKTLPAAPVRTSDIRAVEEATAAAFPGTSNTWVDGWLVRAGDGITERSNSAVPLGPGAGTSPVPLDGIRDFYRRHDLPTRLLLPDRLGRPAEPLAGAPGVDRGPEIIVMTRPLTDLPPDQPNPLGARLELLDRPDDAWLSLYHFRGRPLPERALRLLADRIDGELVFARLTVGGELVAVTRGTVTAGGDRRFLGYSAVEVAPSHRRRGLGRLLTAAMLHWGAGEGADAAALQVVAGNTAGRGLYHSLDFSEHHRHRCLTLPDG